MPYSENTIISSSSVPTEILAKNYLKLIVITQDEQLTSLADALAQQAPMGFKRIVVLINDVEPDLITAQFPDLPASLTNVLAFSVSTINKVACILKEDDIIDIPGIDYAFILASDTKYN